MGAVMRIKSAAIDWAMDERRRLLEEISVLPQNASNVQTTAALTYLRDRLGKLNVLICALEQGASQDA